MRLATIRVGLAEHVAAVTDEGVVDLAITAARLGWIGLDDHVWLDLTSLLELGDDGLATAAEVAARGEPQPLEQTRFAPPVARPRKLLLLAGNYAEHILEGAERLHESDRATPRPFMKPPSTCLHGPFDDIPIPPVARWVDWEAELAVVIGRRCKGVSATEAMDSIAGYLVLNDVSERDLKLRERAETREIDGFFDWLGGKWLDGFAPCGPWLTTADAVPDPHALDIRLTVNGEVQQEGSTGQMIFGVGEIIEYLAATVTLEPGDIIATGTCAGVGRAKGLRLQPGDLVRVEIGHLGAIENRCVAVER